MKILPFIQIALCCSFFGMICSTTIRAETVIFSENFDSGLPSENWEYYSSNSTYGRIQAVGGRMGMDVTNDSNNSLNEAIFTVNLAGASSASLSFQQIDTGDEETTLPANFTGHYNGDGVSISVDGFTWYTVINALELNTASLTTFNVDLLAQRDAIRSNYDADFAFTSDFKIKFQQYDNFASPTDGREWDNISIIADVEPPLISLMTTGTEFLEGDSGLIGTVSIDSAPVTDLLISIGGSAELEFPASVVIPAGQSSVDFSFSAVDDTAASGSQLVDLVASASGYTSASVGLTIHDDESPYTVTFDLDGKGTLDSGNLVQQVVWGQAAKEPLVTANPRWLFNVWNSDFSSVTADVTITAEYLPIHHVTFNLGVYGSLFSGQLVQNVLDGQVATAPEIRVADDWGFIGWDQSFLDVSSDLTVNATYLEKHLVGYSERAKFSSDLSVDDRYGWSIDVSGEIMVVGAKSHLVEGANTGGLHVYRLNDDLWIEEAILLPESDSPPLSFGKSVAIHGDTIVAGSYYANQVYVFVREEGVWRQQAELPDIDWGYSSVVSIFEDRITVGVKGKAYIFRREFGVWYKEAEIVPDSAYSGEFFGQSISLASNVVAIGDYSDRENGVYSGSVSLYRLNDGTWSLDQRLTASDAHYKGTFGISVSISRNTLVVGSDDSGYNASGNGSAYVFEYNVSSGWTEVSKLVADNITSGDFFGHSVSVSGDIIAVGCYGDDSGSYNSGSVYVYKRELEAWPLWAKLIASDGAINERFGWSVAVDGDILSASAYNYEPYDKISGKSYIFDIGAAPVEVTFDLGTQGQRSGGGELVQQTIAGSAAIEPLVDSAEGWYFTGWDISFGTVFDDLIVTAQYLPTYEVEFDLGLYGTYEGGGELRQIIPLGHYFDLPLVTVVDGWIHDGWSDGTSAVSESTRIEALYVQGYSVNFALGDHANIISGDLQQTVKEGGTAIAPVLSVEDGWDFVGWDQQYHNVKGDLNVSALFVETGRNGILSRGVGTHGIDYSIKRYGADDRILSISGDTMVVVSQVRYDIKRVYVLVLEGSSWVEQAELVPDSEAEGEDFGYSVAISGDTIIVGAINAKTSGSSSTGCAYVFVRSGTEWTQQAKLIANDASAGDYFGNAVALDGDTAVIGACRKNTVFADDGGAYVFKRSGGIWTERAQLLGTEVSDSDYFGYSVSISDKQVAVGAPYAPDYERSRDAGGAVYLFSEQENEWILNGKFYDQSESSFWFGMSVCMDSNRLSVSASESIESGLSEGTVSIYNQIDGVWLFEQKLLPETEGLRFGYSSSLNGNRIAVAGTLEGLPGVASIFVLQEGEWTLTDSFSGEVNSIEAYEDTSVCLNGDTLLVVASGEGLSSSGSSGSYFYAGGKSYIYDLGVAPFLVDLELGDYATRVCGGGISQEVIAGEAAILPELEVLPGMVFTGWSESLSNVSEDILAVAQFEPGSIVRFDLGDHGSLVSGKLVQTVTDRASAIVPVFTTNEGWAFAGWSGEYSNVSENITIEAEYLPIGLAGLKLEAAPFGNSTYDYFGSSVSVSGNTVAIGSMQNDDAGSNAGAVYIYVRKAGAWSQEAKLVASDGGLTGEDRSSLSDRFGRSVSLSGDVLAVGTDEKGVYLFVRDNGNWKEMAKINHLKDYQGLGSIVSILDDTLLLTSSEPKNAVHLYQRAGDQWLPVSTFTADEGEGDSYGSVVSMSENTILIGDDQDDRHGEDAGIVYVYHREDCIWVDVDRLAPSNIAAGDRFGGSVSISGESSVIGASHANRVSDSSKGVAYIFNRYDSSWVESVELVGSNLTDTSYFGADVSIFGDIVAIASNADHNSSNTSAGIYIFHKNGDSWEERAKIIVDYPISYFTDIPPVEIQDTFLVVGGLYGDFWTQSFIYNIGVPPSVVTFEIEQSVAETISGELSQLVKYGSPAVAPIIEPIAGWLFESWDTDFSNVTTDLVVAGLFAYDSSNSDTDDLWDGWEQVHLGGTGLSDGSGDADGDSRSDYAEFISGSDPMDPNDYFRLTEEMVIANTGKVTLRFMTNDDIIERRYRILYTDDLSSDSWDPLPMGSFAPDTGDSTEKTFDVPGAEGAYFFKVEAFMEE